MPESSSAIMKKLKAKEQVWLSKWAGYELNHTQFHVQGECNCDECIDYRMCDKFFDEFNKKVIPTLFNGIEPIQYTREFNQQIINMPALSHHAITSGHYLVRSAFVVAYNNKLRAVKKPRVYCRHCGALHNSIDMYTQPDVGPVCQECKSKYYISCEECGTIALSGEVDVHTITVHYKSTDPSEEYRVEHKTICQNCRFSLYVNCGECGDIVPVDQLHRFDRNGNSVGRENPATMVTYCNHCVQDAFFTCPLCGERGLRQSSVPARVGDRSERICRACQMLRQDVLAYNDRPKPKFVVYNEQTTPRPDSPFFGVEFEFEMTDVDRCCSRKQLARIIKEFIGTNYMYSKHDGSLLSIDGERGRGGLEVVTHPFSWKFYKNKPEIFEKLFKIIQDRKWYARSERCGNHIHITKDSFTSFHLFKFMRFFYNKRNRPFFKVLSGRINPDSEHCQRYCRWWPEDEKRLGTVVKIKRNMVPDKHGAVNLLNRDTIEIRIFQGVDTMDDFKRNMEFVHSLHTFSREASAKECMLSKYITFLCDRGNQNQYRRVIKYIIDNAYRLLMYPELKPVLENEKLYEKVKGNVVCAS